MRRLLPRLVIEVPCPADWRAMEPIRGDRRVRLCRACDKPVYDSRSMTRADLHALIEKTEGAPPCLQLHQRPDGTIVTKGCLAAIYQTGRHLWLKAVALAVAFWGGVIGLREVCEFEITAPPPMSLESDGERPRVMMGMVSLRRPEPPPPWLQPPPKKTDLDHAPPLRRLESEQALLPPGWRE